MRLGSDHVRGVWGTTRGSSARGRGRRCFPRRGMMSQWAMGLDMARGGFKTGGALIEGAVDVNVSKFPALEAGFVVSGMVVRQGSVMVAASPPNFSAFQGGFLSFG